ncbi:fibronectin type III domain-containing protein [bacterium]|nr:fibronectin type III domain-containing protein [bacterium]
MRKRKIVGAILSVFVLGFALSWFPTPVEAKAKLQTASSTHSFYPSQITDVTDGSYLLDEEEVLAFYQANEGKTYSINANWDKDWGNYLEFVLTPQLPENIQIEEAKLIHYFFKSAVNDRNLIEDRYRIDFAYQGDFEMDVQSATNDISAYLAGAPIEEEIDLLALFPSLSRDDLSSLAVRFQVRKEDVSGGVAKTDHDYFALKITYNHLPEIELQSPQNGALLNTESENWYGYPATEPEFAWQGEDADGDTLVYLWQLAEKTGSQCQESDFYPPLKQELLFAENYQIPSSEALSEGEYCWRVGVSDDGGNTYSWSEIWEFKVDITPPPNLEPGELKVEGLTQKPTKNSRPRVYGELSSSHTDTQGVVAFFVNVAQQKAYFFWLPVKNNRFDSHHIGARIFVLTDWEDLSGQDLQNLDQLKEVKELEDGIYKILAFAVDEAFNFSEEALILDLLYRLDTRAPLAPQVSVVYREGKVIVSWDSVEDGAYYEVYRDGNLVAYTQSTMFVEENLPQGQTYTYWVVAVDQAGNRSEPSERVKVYIPKPRVSSITYQPAVSYVPSVLVPEAEAKTKAEEKEEKVSQAQPEVAGEVTPEAKKTAVWLWILIAVGLVLVALGGLYWWYSRAEEEI